MSENRYLDTFTSGINESDYAIEIAAKEKILRKAKTKIKGAWFNFKIIAAACILLVVLSALIPNTPVNALCRKIFSFIPGVGVVQNAGEEESIKAVLSEPAKIIDKNQFVEVKTAYIKGKMLRLSIKTNVGAIDAGEFASPETFKFFAGEISPKLYLLGDDEKLKSGHSSYTGPSYETRVYSVDASFALGEADIDKQEFSFELEGFNKEIKISLSPVNSHTEPGNLGNMAVVGDMIIFANTSRENGVLEVLLSYVAPKEYKSIRVHLFEHEKELFNTGVYLIDEEGNKYMPDEEIRQKNSGSINQLYFRVADHKEGLKLILPQILYGRRTTGNAMRVSMPLAGKEQKINKVLDLPGAAILIETASLVPSGDPLLPDEFREHDCLKIAASAKTGADTEEMVVRVLPIIEVSYKAGFSDTSVSQSIQAELWDGRQSGYSLAIFESMDKTKKVFLGFDVEYALTGPWEINLR